MEGKRKRKATKQFSVEIAPPKKKVAKKPVGSGTKLQDIPSGMMCNPGSSPGLSYYYSGLYIE